MEGLTMSYVSKLIYREINNLIPDLKKIKPLEQLDLKAYGFANIHLIVLESKPEEVNFILTRYNNTNGSLIANPSVEIVIYPRHKGAELVAYKAPNFTYQFLSEEDENYNLYANSYATRLVYDWLKELKIWNCNKKDCITTNQVN